MTSEGLAPAEATRHRELQGLQFIRATAALMVVLTHSVAVLGLPEYFDEVPLGGVFDKATVGVHIFFVVSGFIIVYVALAESSLCPRLSAGNFLLKRFVRIVPFMWVTVLAYAAVRFVGAGEVDVPSYLRSFFLIPVGDVAPDVIWTLRHEALFYLVFAVAILARKHLWWLLAVWCASPVVVWAAEQAGTSMPESELFRFVFSDVNALFGCGALLGLACQRYGLLHRHEVRVPFVGWLLILAGCALAFVAYDDFGMVAVAAAATLTVVAGLVTAKSDSLVARAWEFLGDASYSIHLTHPLVLAVAGRLWLGVVGDRGFIVAVAAGIAGSTILGCLAHVFVEKPLIRIVRNALDERRHSLSRA